MSPFNWGILGGGDVARRMVVPALQSMPDAQPVAVANRRIDNARQFAQSHGIAAAYDSVDALLAHPGLDAVYVATPNALHRKHVVAAARAGKHVLCDKPMALTEDDAQAMVDACREHGVTLGVVFQNRYHPAHMEARNQVSAGTLGEFQLAHAQLCVGRARGHWQGWRLDPAVAGSGAIVGQAVHPIDLLRFVLDTEVVEVAAMTDEKPPERPVDDMSHVILRLANGGHAHVTAGTLAPRSANDLVLYGSAGRIACRGTLATPLPGAVQKIEIDADTGKREEERASSSPQRVAALIADFQDCARTGREPTISGRNGLQMVRIANAVQRAAREGCTVRLSPSN